MELTDNFGRIHNYLRISLTDRCNLNCIYCNPVLQKAEFIGKQEILTFEEIARLINIFAEFFNFKKFRFTGGEPLARKGFVSFISGLKDLKGLYGFKTAITTNGVLLADIINDVFDAGIDNINISLDSLNPKTFKNITGKSELHRVLYSVFRAKELSFDELKINCVVMRGINDTEIIPFADFAVHNDINVRFIEYMPFSNNGWSERTFISAGQIKKIIDSKYSLIESSFNGSVSKDYFIGGKKGQISFISSISDHFCDKCSRLRITAKGGLRLCLFSEEKQELDLKLLLNNNTINDYEIAEEIMEFVKTKLEKHPDTNELIKMDYNYMLRNGG
jgi:molybdenum cofactor biosynthesis protein A